MSRGAHEIAHALGGRRAQRLADGSYLVPCPVPTHGKGRGDRNPSLRVGDGAARVLVHCFGGCDPRDVLDELRRRSLLDDQPYRVSEWDRRAVDAQAERRHHRDGDDRVRIERARAIFDEARDPRGTLGETYFGLRRLVLDEKLACRVLRYHPRCPWRNENTGNTDRVPALIVPFRSIDDDAITGIHRIALTSDGHKLGKRMLGVVHRAAVKLDDAVDDELAIGEGVETCIAARMLGITPTWALGSVGMIAHFPLIPGIALLRIIGENDSASDGAIELCGTRWQRAGRNVRVIKPRSDRKDLNDALGAHAYDGTGR